MEAILEETPPFVLLFFIESFSLLSEEEEEEAAAEEGKSFPSFQTANLLLRHCQSNAVAASASRQKSAFLGVGLGGGWLSLFFGVPCPPPPPIARVKLSSQSLLVVPLSLGRRWVGSSSSGLDSTLESSETSLPFSSSFP